jgi:hypothetical protein
MHDLFGGGVLIDAEKGWFRYDPAQARLLPAGDAATGACFCNTLAARDP